ncbi:unnamed protein product [Boreogadus saida]
MDVLEVFEVEGVVVSVGGWMDVLEVFGWRERMCSVGGWMDVLEVFEDVVDAGLPTKQTEVVRAPLSSNTGPDLACEEKPDVPSERRPGRPEKTWEEGEEET